MTIKTKKISILHLASDEKFINAANHIFEIAFPDCNHFVIPYSRFRRTLNFVKKTPNIQIVPFGDDLIQILLEKTLQYDCIVMHGITELNSKVFLLSNDKHKFIGILWGAELYNKNYFQGYDFLGELTRSIKLKKPDQNILDYFKVLIRNIVYKNNRSNVRDSVRSASLQLQYLCVPYEEEFCFFRDHKLISDNCKHISFTYYPLEYIMKGNENSVIQGNDILVGNSASFTNNHLEVFRILKTQGIDSRKIYVPLSYGDAQYADYIQMKGNELFNGNFRALRNFMPLEDYNRMLQTCGITIMNHYRQQAVGNIFMMLLLGSRVYLNETNTVYRFLKRIGIKVFSIEHDLVSGDQNKLCNLASCEIEHNRSILKELLSEVNIISRLREGILEHF